MSKKLINFLLNSIIGHASHVFPRNCWSPDSPSVLLTLPVSGRRVKRSPPSMFISFSTYFPLVAKFECSGKLLSMSPILIVSLSVGVEIRRWAHLFKILTDQDSFHIAQCTVRLKIQLITWLILSYALFSHSINRVFNHFLNLTWNQSLHSKIWDTLM